MVRHDINLLEWGVIKEGKTNLFYLFCLAKGHNNKQKIKNKINLRF